MPGITRRSALVGVLVAAAAAASTAYFTDGFGLLPREYAALPVFAEAGLAIRGYDPVAYFREGRPVPGTEAFSTSWNGATWRFASAANRDAFLADPEAYAPQYGGFCAWAVAAKGKLYATQPSNWSIVEGKLYLNYNDDIQAKWEADIAGFIAEGDRRWPEALGAR